MALGDLAYYRHVFGQSTPLALYGGVVPEAARSSPVSAVLGFLLDRSFGLLPHAPVFLIAALGLVLLGARARQDAWPHLLTGLAVLAPLLTWRMWWGGQCPPGRFLVPLVPVLAAALALRAAEPVRGLARWRGPLLALGLALAGFMAADPGGLMLLNRARRPTRVWDALSGETPLGRYLPSLTLPDAAEWRVALLWALALGTLIALDRLARDHDRIDEWFRGLVLPVLLILGVGAGVDAWARTPAPLGGIGASEGQLLSLSCQRSFSFTAYGSPGVSAVSSTSSIDETRWILTSFRTFSGRASLTAFSLRLGRMTSLTPSRWAARTFSLIPPTGSTRPARVISPVMATRGRTARPVSSDTIAVTRVMPAEGPSLGMAPSGTWRCRSTRSKNESSMPSCRAWARTQERAVCALSFMTSPSWPVRLRPFLPNIWVASM